MLIRDQAARIARPAKAEKIKHFNVRLEPGLKNRWEKFCKNRNTLQRMTAQALEEFMDRTILEEKTKRAEVSE